MTSIPPSGGEGEPVYVLSYQRTPIGSQDGLMSQESAATLGAAALKAAIDQANVYHHEQIDLIVAGQVEKSNFEPNIARYTALNTCGLPGSIVGRSVDMQCASGLHAIFEIWQQIKYGPANLAFALGVDTLSFVHGMAGPKFRQSAPNRFLVNGLPPIKRWLPRFLQKSIPTFKAHGPLFFAGMLETGLGPMNLMKDATALGMIPTAENVAALRGISRAKADKYAAMSYQRFLDAGEWLKGEIVPVVTRRGVCAADEYPIETSLGTLSRMKPSGKTDQVTPGNASKLGNGASCVGLGTRRMAEQLGLWAKDGPMIKVRAFQFVGHSPETMGLAPIQAVYALLKRLGLRPDEVDLYEVNEAFPAVVISFVEHFGLDYGRVNVNGGAIACGHPLGVSGNRLFGTAHRKLKQRKDWKNAIVVLCVGGGMAGAAYLEKVQ